MAKNKSKQLGNATAKNSPEDDLEIINKWLERRFEFGNFRPSKKDPTGESELVKIKNQFIEIKNQFIEQKINRLRQCIGIPANNQLLVTTRSSFRKSSLHLRPVYSYPEILGDLLLQQEVQKPFRFDMKKKPFSLNNEELLHSEDKIGDVAPPSFCALHKLDIDNKDSDTSTFAGRIDSFWQTLRMEDEPGLQKIVRKNYRNDIMCLFAGRNRNDKKYTKILNLEHIFALYFRNNNNQNPLLTKGKSKKKLIEARIICESLFHGLDLIAGIDAVFFRAEGLELVAKLSPEFAKTDVARADKIAFAIERLKKLLELHTVGRPGGGEPPNVYYQAATFEPTTGEDHRITTVAPRLELYPSCYRKNDEYRLGSFLISHKSIPTASKFLLHRYFKNDNISIVAVDAETNANAKADPPTRVRLCDSFTRLFKADALETLPLDKWQDDICPPNEEDSDSLNMSAYDDHWEKRTDIKDFSSQGDPTEGNLISPWQALNLNLSSKNENKSLAAFVVEGKEVTGNVENKARVTTRCLPLGVFAVESKYIDAFSDSDLISLRDIFEGIAGLIRQISHHHFPINYRSKVAGPLVKLIPDTAGEFVKEAAKLLFLLQKIDGKELNDLCNGDLAPRNKTTIDLISKKCDLDVNDLEIIRSIATQIESNEDGDTTEFAENVIQDRIDTFRSFLSSERNFDNLVKDKVIQFLEACTENYVWIGYLNGMSQSIGDRIRGKTPNFESMTPGFNATDIFMARVDDELRQVAKLASANALRREMRAYRHHVRYKLVNAARLSENAFAFDTCGDEGFNSANSLNIQPAKLRNRAFGVLVSDLVSGGGGEEAHVRSFLDVTAHVFRNKPENSWPKFKKIRDAVKTVFNTNCRLWNTNYTEDPEGAGLPAYNLVDLYLRLPSGRKSEKYKEVEDRRRKILKSALDNFDKLRGSENTSTSNFYQKEGFQTNKLQDIDLEKRFSVTHGDMNARNLTWSSELVSFFLIDFEYVGPGIRGMDQFRLAMNTMTTVWGAWVDQRGAEKEDIGMLDALTVGEEFFIQLFERLLGKGNLSLVAVVNELLKDLKTQDSPKIDQFVGLLGDILKTTYLSSREWDQGKPKEWQIFWAYVTYAVTMREYTYSADPKRVDLKILHNLQNKCNFFNDEYPTIHKELKGLLDDQGHDYRTESIGYYMRNIVGSRLLHRMVEYLAKRKPSKYTLPSGDSDSPVGEESRLL